MVKRQVPRDLTVRVTIRNLEDTRDVVTPFAQIETEHVIVRRIFHGMRYAHEAVVDDFRAVDVERQ
ncbi:hypothetical protein D3C84_1153790 [compost metagenome]